MQIPRRIHAQLKRLGVRTGDRLLVAFSGGADSAVLLHALRFHLGADVVAAHFDHRMRDSSAADAAWVRGVCRAWGVPLIEAAAERPLRSEADARSARYAFLKRAAARNDARWVLTAHHADDQIETIVFRLMRGTGPDGLRGIPGRRGRLLRPMLGIHRWQILAYARAQGLRYREDPTNASRQFARNRIRHDVLPAMRREVPDIDASILRLARAARQSRAAWNRLLREAETHVVISQTHASFELARPELLGYHRAIRTRLVRRLLARLGSVPGRAGTRSADTFISSGRSGTGITLRGGIRIAREHDVVRLTRGCPDTPPEERPLLIPVPEAGAGEAVVGGRTYTACWSNGSNSGAGPVACFDPSDLRFPLVIRGWRPGDRIRLAGGSRKLKKLFTDRKIGRAARSTMPVVVDRDNNVLWVVGLAQAVTGAPSSPGGTFRITVS